MRPGFATKTYAARLVITSLTLLPLAGCPLLGEEAGVLKSATHETDDLPILAKSKYLPPSLPAIPPEARPSVERVKARIHALGDRLDNLNSDDAWETLGGACDYVDLVEAGKSPDDAMSFVVQKFGGDVGTREEFRSLTQDFASADSNLDRSWVLGKAALCEAADAHERSAG